MKTHNDIPVIFIINSILMLAIKIFLLQMKNLPRTHRDQIGEPFQAEDLQASAFVVNFELEQQI